MTDLDLLDGAFADCPVVAILRGLRGEEAIAVVGALYEAGIRVAEVPLNSPEPFETIALLVREFGERMVIGAGTVLREDEVDRLAETGARISVSPDCKPAVIARACAHGLIPMPGVASASEAFRAIDAGATWLKWFPAGEQARATIAAVLPVLPSSVRIVAVGGVGARNGRSFLDGGCAAIGVGSELYRAGVAVEAVARSAERLVAGVRASSPRGPARIADTGAIIGESPILDRDGRAVLLVDPVSCELLAVSLATGEVARRPTEVPIHAIGWRGPELVGITDAAFVSIDPSSARVSHLADAPVTSGCRLNDMTIDAAGAVWAGSMHRGLLAGRGELFRLDSNGRVERVFSGLGACNGMGLSPDGERLFLVDTLARTLIGFPVNAGSASLGEPTIVSDFMAVPGKPDGMEVDASGRFFVAMWGGGCVAELASDGSTRHLHDVPAPQVSSLCLDGDTMIVSTSRMRLSLDHPAFANSGALFRLAK